MPHAGLAPLSLERQPRHGFARVADLEGELRCVAVTNTSPAAELRADAELVVAGLDALTLEALDALCAD